MMVSPRYIISHTDGPDSFYLQCVDNFDSLVELGHELAHGGEFRHLKEPRKGEIVAAQDEEGYWHRARVISSLGQDLRVFFLDYGHAGSCTDARKLPMKLACLDPLATRCCLSPKREGMTWSLDAAAIFNEFVYATNPEFSCTVLKEGDPKKVTLTWEDCDVSDVVTRKCQRRGVKPFEQEIPKRVVISHVESVEKFFVQEVATAQTLDSMTKNLEKAASFLEIQTPKVGDLLASLDPIDRCWYRTKILSLDPTMGVFIDYGNSSILKQFRKLPSELHDSPPLCYQVGLKLPEGKVWKAEADSLLKSKCTGFIYDMSGEDNVALIHEGKNLIDDLTLEETPKVYITHFDSLNSIFVQFEKSDSVLEFIAREMSSADNFEDLNFPKPGVIIGAKFPEDGSWYRATLVSLPPVIVRFVDYGNTAIVHECKSLPPELSSISPLAIRCRLETPSTPELEYHFREITSDDSKVFEMKVLDERSPKTVDFVFDGISVTETLMRPYEKNVTVSWFVSLENFYVRYDSDKKIFQEIEQFMVRGSSFTNLKTPKGNKMVAVRDSDGLWYRGVFIEEGVRLVDIGKSVFKKEVRELPESLQAVPGLALHCSLGNRPWKENAEKEFQKLTSDGCVLSYFEEGDPKIVTLTVQGQNIANLLEHRDPITSQEPFKVVCSYFESLEHFYVQYYSKRLELESVIAILASVEDYPKVKKVRTGQLLLAQNPTDRLWYRARVMSLRPDVTVQFIDYGTTAIVKRFRKMSKELKQVEQLAESCQLNRPQGTDPWTHDERIKSLMSTPGEIFDCRIISWKTEPMTVELYFKGKSVADLFKNNKLLVEPTTGLDQDKETIRVKIMHAVNPDEFYVREEKHARLAEKVNTWLKKNGHKLETIEPKLGETVCCQWNRNWFRGEVMSLKPLVVYLVDQGESAVVREVKRLPEEVARVQVLATKAKLPLLPAASPEALNAFDNFLAEEGYLKARVIQPGCPLTLDLFKSNTSLFETIKGLV